MENYDINNTTLCMLAADEIRYSVAKNIKIGFGCPVREESGAYERITDLFRAKGFLFGI